MERKAKQMEANEHKIIFDHASYELSRNEAETVVAALTEYIENHKEEKHGDKASL